MKIEIEEEIDKIIFNSNFTEELRQKYSSY